MGCPHLEWAASGAMALTGEPGAAPVLAPGAVIPRLRSLAGVLGLPLDPGLLLSGRAGLRGLSRNGRASVGGASRLLRTTDGWAAVTLSRPDDVAAVSAMFGGRELAEAAAERTADELVERIRLFDVPAAVVPSEVPAVASPWRSTPIARPDRHATLEGAVVVDFSSLWAGPLCAQLLGRLGARVTKVESTRRPDGARAGDPRFYDWLHAGQESVTVDFNSASGRAALADLVDRADVVIEASRPRAFARLGIAPEQRRHRAGKVWLSITGYGRRHPGLVAFGDDAAAAGGLVGRTSDGPVFCADAIADPLTGVAAAAGALTALRSGGGRLVDVAMRDVAAWFAGAPAGCSGDHPVRRAEGGWVVRCSSGNREQRVLPVRSLEDRGSADQRRAHLAGIGIS